tara:strand:- start:1430 stop:3187 length:1758 start_codon:yes stop_codon:yes gene_type:complete
MTPEIITLLVLAGIFVALFKELVTPAVAFLIGLAALVIAGIVDTNDALAGFSNDSLITIASLFVIAKAIENNVQLNTVTQKVFGKSKSVRMGLARIVTPVAVGSAFVNNTPIVAMFINPIIAWSKRNHIPASKFLIPLSYAAILGGTLTLIGTSTNLVVSGLLVDFGFEPFSFFEMTSVTLPLVIICLAIIVWLGPKLIPERNFADFGTNEIEKKFVFDTTPKRTLIGKSVSQAGLRNLKSVFLAEILRSNGDVVSPVRPVTQIRNGDVLRFSGSASALAELADHHSLRLVEDKHAKSLSASSVYVEAVVGHNMSMADKTLADIGFRAKYQAAVLAIFRAGERISGSLGTIPLRPGDSLLLVTDEHFVERWDDRNDFLYMRQIGRTKTDKKANVLIAGTILLTVILIALGVPLFIATLCGALSTVLLHLLSTAQARHAIDFELLIMIAAAIGVASGVDSSGLAQVFGSSIIDYFGAFGIIGLLLGVIIATTILTEVITNAAAASLVFPIAIATATASGADPRMFAIAIAVTASMSFISPLGYQTNTMVYSAGGYKFSDFLRVGLVLNIITTIVLTLLLAWYFGVL